MKKTFLTRLFTVLIIVTLLLSACGNSTTKNYDDLILQRAEEQLSTLPYVSGRTFSVEYSAVSDLYTVDINGTELKFNRPLKSSNSNKLEPSTGEELSKKEQKIVDSSKKLICSYIDNSNILQNKEAIKQFVNDIPTYVIDMDDGALYFNGKLFISIHSLDVICEWMITHELVHALADFTNGGVENEKYAYFIFNEALTDIITASMNPKIPNDALSGYINFHPVLYSYIGCFGEDAINAYFYGYESLIEKIGNKHELDFFVFSVENLNTNEYALVCINNSINHWRELEN